MTAVLDASAILAVFNGEPGSGKVAAVLAAAQTSAVNLAEVVTKLQERGVPDDEIDDWLSDLDLSVVPFDFRQAMATGKLRRATRSVGPSLGDRACLALAHSLGATALTTDRQWAKVDAGVTVEVIR